MDGGEASGRWVGSHAERTSAALLMAAAALALGQAIQISNGNLHPAALSWLSGALLVTAVAAFLPAPIGLERRLPAFVAALMVIGLAWQFTELYVTPPGIYVRYAPGWHLSFFQTLAVAAVASGALWIEDRRWRTAAVILALACYAVLGAWMVRSSPAPVIDVFVFQRDSAQALLRGDNPYAITFPDLYGHSLWYGPGLLQNGRLQFGYPYMPLSLFFSVLSQVFGGDVRYAQLVAVVGAAALMAFTRQSRLGALAAAVYLFTPRGLFVLEQSWTEPFVVLFLAAAVFAATRWPRALPYVLGLLLAVKQYLVLAAPLALLLLPRPWTLKSIWDVAWRAFAVFAVVTLPLVLWDAGAFLHSAVTLQFHQPFRQEALSYLAYWVGPGGDPKTAIAALIAAAGALGLALWRAPRTAGGFALSVAVVFFAFFAFNKQAFANYYFFVIGALCVALAAWADSDSASARLSGDGGSAP